MTHFTKTLLLAAVLFGLFLGAEARPVTMETAQEIASRFMKTGDLHLVATYRTSNNAPALRVFNTPDGFVIVSADDCETPIIGYSHEGSFDPDNVPVQLEAYLQGFVARIQYGIEHRLDADAFTASQWEQVRSTGKLGDGPSSKAVLPLLTSQWHQGCLYNSLCPTMQGPCGHAEVGCVAVAMGQIMHYWGYPATGWGSHSYSNAGVALTANFGETEYQWDLMPDRLTDQSSQAEIDAVATLLYHCGVSVNMYYNNNSSSAMFDDIAEALVQYFDYSRKLHRENRESVSNEEWIAMLKDNLDRKQPILYAAYGSGGHAFVCDGYDDNGLFHFNFGWGGPGDGYYALGHLNPIGYQFNDDNMALFDLYPHYEPCLVDAMVSPSEAGTVEGTGAYHYGDRCTLTAVAADGNEFYCWMRNGQMLSELPSYTFRVNGDFLDIEACFSRLTPIEITAGLAPNEGQPEHTDVLLSWSLKDNNWILLNQFEVHGETGGIATDGEHLYVTYANWGDPPFMFEQYTLDGVLVDAFNVDGIPDAFALAYDGSAFYCNGFYALQCLYHLDLDQRKAIDSTLMINGWFDALAYDPVHDGFWLSQDYNACLYNRQGQLIQWTPSFSDFLVGIGFLTAPNGDPHLLLVRDSGVYDYDIPNRLIHARPLLEIGAEETVGYGACVATYDGKDALFMVVDDAVRIYEIKDKFLNNNDNLQIVHYRLYRSDSEGHTVMLADEVSGGSYLDTTWSDIPAGTYRYGISMVFADGETSGVLWSDPLVKTDYGVGETPWSPLHRVQKILENGRLYLLVNGKKYTVMGQEVAK